MSEMKRTIEAIFDSYELEIRMLDEAIQRVRELHERKGNICLECADTGWGTYPCPTIKALDGEQ
jgi:hypothetical protein